MVRILLLFEQCEKARKIPSPHCFIVRAEIYSIADKTNNGSEL
jgi:hypothetical protein